MLDTAHKKLRPLSGRSYQKLRPSCVHMWPGTLLGYTMLHVHFACAFYMYFNPIRETLHIIYNVTYRSTHSMYTYIAKHYSSILLHVYDTVLLLLTCSIMRYAHALCVHLMLMYTVPAAARM